jgi:serine/threonine-protein kinase HipA
MCPGCYDVDAKGYCLSCRKLLFDGAKVSPTLNFDSPKAGNLPAFQEKTSRLSISGVQLKYSLMLDGKELKLTEKRGQYILKPIPPTTLIANPGQAPENEHLTMQIASQIFGIRAAPNALIYFSDGTPAYLTRRFDVQQDGSKHLQEDMAQISGQSRQSLGENFKYDGSYDRIGEMIRIHVAAFHPALENFFRIVLFNYIFSNGDAHLKNFSLIRTSMGDYTLSPAYDLMSTVLHTPHETDTALNLYEGDLDSEYYNKYGCYGQPNFRELANRIGLIPMRSNRIISYLLMSRDRVEGMIRNSFLEEEVKGKYLAAYRDKLHRMGLTEDMIGQVIDPKTNDPYAPTTAPTKLVFRDGSIKVGYFQKRPQLAHLENENKYTFIDNGNKADFRKTNDDKYVTIVDGDELVDVEYEGMSILNSGS